MAKAEKYRLDFYTHQGDQCRVSFFVEGHVGDITSLIGTSRPFVLTEFNNDEDVFKPIRALKADVEIIASSSTVSSDGFLANADTDIELRFFFIDMATPFWKGYVLQTEFEEVWFDGNHILKVSATDGFGMLQNIKLSNNGSPLDGMYTPFQYLAFAMQDMPFDLTIYTIINNLYHDSMSSTLPQTCLVQTQIDSRTFEETPTLFNDCYKVIENINRAFNQTIFQYYNGIIMLRLEDLYAPTTTNLRGVSVNGATITNLSRRYDVQIGVNQTLKPITPDMLRFIRRQVKSNTIQYNYDNYNEVVKNSSFSKGSLLSVYPDFKDYSIDNFTLVEGDFVTNTNVTTTSALRREIFTSNVGPLIDNYIIIPQTTASTGRKDYAIKAIPIIVAFNQRIKISVDTKFLYDFSLPGGSRDVPTMWVYLDGITKNYTLIEQGVWLESPPATDFVVDLEYSTTKTVLPTEWNTLEVESSPMPDSGYLYIYLVCPENPSVASQQRYFKNLKIEVANQFDTTEIQLTGVQSIFEKATDLRFDFNDTIIFDSTASASNKGALFENDGVTIADDNWYRFRYSSERHSFRKQNAIARWSHNRYDRNKIDVNLYGVKWNDGGTNKSISLLNTFVFTNDDPNKVYYVSNIREIDYAAATMSLTLEEMWDNARDGAAAATKSLNIGVKSGTYVGRITVPFNVSTNTDFVSTGDDRIYYKGGIAITTPIVVSLAGNIISTTSTPITVTFNLYQNGTIIRTQNLTVSANPFPLSLNLSPAGSITINPNDYFQITYSSSIVSLQHTGGSFQISSYSIPNALNYDPYRDKYLYE